MRYDASRGGNVRRAGRGGDTRAVVFLLFATSAASLAAAQDGAALYEKHCAMCHSYSDPAADGKNVDAAVSDIALTLVDGSLRPDPSVGGELFALDLSTGTRAWHAPPQPCPTERPCSPARSAAVTVIPGVVVSGSIDGHLRAYATGNGTILWDVDTVREYETVNGVAARGGAIDGPGAVVIDGMVYANSGYAFWGALPGNVLLAFSVDGR